MTEENNADFQTAAEILQSLNLTYDESYEKKVQKLFCCWADTVGENLAKFSLPQQFSADGILFIKCSNSVAANEIFNIKEDINKKLKSKAEELKLNKFKYIRIVYN